MLLRESTVAKMSQISKIRLKEQYKIDSIYSSWFD